MPSYSKYEMEVMRQRVKELEAELEKLRCPRHDECQSEKRPDGVYAGFFENNHAVMLLINPGDGEIVDANSAAVKFYGWSREQLKQMNISQINTLTKEQVLCELQNARLARRNHFFFKHRCADGSVHDVEVYSGTINFHNKELVCSIIHDVTKRLHNEEILEKRLVALTRPMDDVSDLEFEDLFDLNNIQKIQDQFSTATGVASVVTRPNGHPITMPSNFTRFCSELVRKSDKGLANCHKSDSLLGCFQADGPRVQECLSAGLWDAGAAIIVSGKHIANWLIGQVRDETQSEERVRRYAREIEVDEEELVQAFYDVPSMNRQRFETIANALYTMANQLSDSAYQNIQQARFITERKKSEEEREKLHHQLTQSQKMESVGRLAGGVAHDFNNMLHVILGHAEMALEGMSLNHPLRMHLEEIECAAQRSADLTRQLLAFARRQTVIPKVLNLNEVIESMLKMLGRLIGEDIELVWEPADDLRKVRIDPSQVDQILANLIVNARDAIGGGGKVKIKTDMVQIETGAEEVPDLKPGEYVLLAISDDGHGMDQETVSRIFEPFYTTKKIGEGTGLGLSTVYGIVQQNHGDVTVRSEPGKGATFSVYLPVYQEKNEDVNQKKKEPPVRAKGHETVLLVEDELTNLRMTQIILEGLGYQVLCASTPYEALKLAQDQSENIDLLITDVVMPRMDGVEMSREIELMIPGVKCLYMSGYTAEKIARHGILEEGMHFIPKPFSRRDLGRKVYDVLGY